MDDVICFMTDNNDRKPQKISTRPRLPQASLHCPPITAGNELGLVVYPNSSSHWEIQRVPEYIQITYTPCLLYTSPSPRDKRQSRMPSSA